MYFVQSLSSICDLCGDKTQDFWHRNENAAKRSKSPKLERRHEVGMKESGDIVAFVCSKRASIINGSNIRAEGGLVRTVFSFDGEDECLGTQNYI